MIPKKKERLYAVDTAGILEHYLSDISGVDWTFSAYAMEKTFGADIHKDVAGFMRYGLDNDLPKHNIQMNLAHDMMGGLNRDKLMLPRVTGYGKYWDEYVSSKILK